MDYDQSLQGERSFDQLRHTHKFGCFSIVLLHPTFVENGRMSRGVSSRGT